MESQTCQALLVVHRIVVVLHRLRHKVLQPSLTSLRMLVAMVVRQLEAAQGLGFPLVALVVLLEFVDLALLQT
jgi:hypothetical protein